MVTISDVRATSNPAALTYWSALLSREAKRHCQERPGEAETAAGAREAAPGGPENLFLLTFYSCKGASPILQRKEHEQDTAHYRGIFYGINTEVLESLRGTEAQSTMEAC